MIIDLMTLSNVNTTTEVKRVSFNTASGNKLVATVPRWKPCGT